MKDKIDEIVSSLTDEEKVSLLQGKDFWNINGIERLNIPSMMVSDGPHGVRKQEGEADHIGLNDSVPSVCYPTLSALSNSWDRDLLERIGKALAKECISHDIGMLLGPGINHKRSPLCGRNFEYFSEDPVLTGKLAASYVKGVQSNGVAACLKHYAVNSQETYRMNTDSIIDERTLFEIYLKAFEIVVKEADPAAVMTAYNLVNGTYCSENEYLMEDIMRKRFGFNGLFVTDWGAISDVVKSFQSGLDLEMPGMCRGTEELVLEAIEKGTLSREKLDACVKRIITLLSNKQDSKPYSVDAHLQLAREAAEKSAVLLKNDNILPLKRAGKTAIIGKMAKQPRYQGSGSSKVNPIELDSIVDRWEGQYLYADGYEDNGLTNVFLIEEAKKAASQADTVVVVAGLPEFYEAEGFDRSHMNLPEGHNQLIHALTLVHSRVVVVLQTGSPVTMPWIHEVQSVLLMNLGGCKSGEATVRLLQGDVNPSGRLSQTFPVKLEDTPCFNLYPAVNKKALYKESIYTGYRYYTGAKKEVLFPFGYGLSYTQFEYKDLKIIRGQNSFLVIVKLKNIGKYAGREVVQCYIGAKDPLTFRAERELKHFKIVELKPGESAEVHFEVNLHDFERYSTKLHEYIREEGMYTVEIGKDVSTIVLSQTIHIQGIEPFKEDYDPVYDDPKNIDSITDEQFYSLFDTKPISKEKTEFTRDDSVRDIADTKPIFKALMPVVSKLAASYTKGDEETETQAKMTILDMPVRTYGIAGHLTKEGIEGLVDIFNGHWIKGIKRMKKNIHKDV